MNKKVSRIMLASSFLVSTAFVASPAFSATESSFMVAENVNNLWDVNSKHWAYGAVKSVVQDLEIMDPKTPNRFKGDEKATRNELAKIFYKTSMKLESLTNMSLKVVKSSDMTKLKDVNMSSMDGKAVNSVVNEYGVMQAMPGNKFMGSEEVSRYELAFELNNYLDLLVKKIGKNTLSKRNKLSGLSDVRSEHWATPSVSNIVNRYQLMDGYPNGSFQGTKSLTRYELAAVLDKFVTYVNNYIVAEKKPVVKPVEKKPVVKPVEKKPMVKPVEKKPVVKMKKPASVFDLKLGGHFMAAYPTKDGKASTDLAYSYGPNADLDFYFGKAPIGIGLDGNLTFFQPAYEITERRYGGASLNWRIAGNDSAEDTQFVLGAGYGVSQFRGATTHGPRGNMLLEIPLGSWLGIFAEGTGTYYTTTSDNQMAWQADVFSGFNIPAYSNVSVQLGYTGTFFQLKGVTQQYGSMGAKGNLRFRF